MFLSIVKWILRKVDISVIVENGVLTLIVEFMGKEVIKKEIVLENIMRWNASPKGEL